MRKLITMETLETAVAAVEDDLLSNNLRAELMHAAFDYVKNRDDWKAPINKVFLRGVCPFSNEVLAAAVLYMTATEASVSEDGNGFVTVKAAGYRAGPAGP